MAIISATTMIRSISLFHLTLAVILLKNPAMISNQGVVLLLGESMQLPTPRDFNAPSASTSFLALLFAFLALTDLTALSLPADISEAFWGTQTPVRLLFLFCLTGYTYLGKEGGMFAARSAMDWRMSKGAGVCNSIVFTWGFFELAGWFWVYTTLREERTARLAGLAEKQKSEADRL